MNNEKMWEDISQIKASMEGTKQRITAIERNLERNSSVSDNIYTTVRGINDIVSDQGKTMVVLNQICNTVSKDLDEHKSNHWAAYTVIMSLAGVFGWFINYLTDFVKNAIGVK